MTPTTAYTLTPLQQSMYASAAFTGQPWLYVEQIVIDLPGERLEPAAMERAWSDLIVAHPALRNAIISDPSAMPKQSPQPPAGVNLNVLDWSAQSTTENTGALSAFLRADRDRGVDASRAPAFRVTLIQTGPSSSKLIWTFPHSLLDGRSFAPLLDEVFTRYALHASGQDVPAPIVQPDVFAAHCQQLARQPHSDGIDHFANLLHGWEGATALADRTAEPARKTFARHTLSPDQTTALNTLARACDVPVSTVVLAAWAIVLARFTGQSDVVFGNTRNGRHLVAGAQGAAGCFITTVPMRVTLSAGMQLATVLRKLREEQLAARRFEHTPLSALRQRLDLQPDRQIFDSVVMFDYGSLHDQLVALNPAWASREADLLEEGDTPVTLAAYMGDQLRIELEYDPSQVADGARLSQYLATFLERLEDANGSTQLAQIPMLPQGETDRLYALAGPDTTSPHGIATAIDRFEQVASQYPDAIALQQPGQDDLSYAVLNAAATARAQALLTSGVAPGDIVGICLPRGPEFITSLLATWKIGAAFVPMDPAYPVETLNVLAEDSGAKIVLVDENSPRVAAPRLDIETLCIPDGTALPPQARTDPDSLAYVIFTSGSTGRPKGVMISHRSLAAHIDAVVPLYELGQSDRVLQFAALSFDVALEEIVPTLTLGGTLVLRNDEMAQSVSELVRQCVAYRITVMNLPTGFWVALTDVLDQGKITFPPDVRLMIVGGERVPMSALRRWRACNPDLRWINGYGPTEATITSTAHVLQDTDLDLPAVPIGRPLAHARAWVLGPDGALAPEGVEGELFLSGPAVALGYIGAPERTAQSFLPAPFDPNVGRLYATGDRVCWSDGRLDYLGRMDRQIKLRGFRIEPGQIEAAIEAKPGIDRVHTAIHHPNGATPTLVTWYSTTDGTARPASEMQDWAAQTLPAHMRPHCVHVVDWPMTPGGKIDTRALPAPSSDTPAQDTAEDTSSTPLTEEVARLFEQILGITGVRPETSFFQAGGDSLALLRLMPELETTFGVHLKPTAIYTDPTPRGVALALQKQDPDPLVVIQIQPEGTNPHIYGVHVLGDDGSYFRPMAAELGPDQPVFGLTVGLLTENTPTSVPDIARFYLHQIERHYPEGPLSLLAVSAGSYITLELAHQLLDAGREIEAFVLLDAEGPGGRPAIPPLARLGVHALQALRQGYPYVAKRLQGLREKRMQDRALRQMRKDVPVEEPIISPVDDFVAANLLAIEEYQPRPLPVPMTIFRAADNLFDTRGAIASGLGWSDIAAAGFELIDVPGDHLGILDATNVATLAGHLRDILAKRRKES